MDYAKITAYPKVGAIGIKVRIIRPGTKFPDKIKIKDYIQLPEAKEAEEITVAKEEAAEAASEAKAIPKAAEKTEAKLGDAKPKTAEDAKPKAEKEAAGQGKAQPKIETEKIKSDVQAPKEAKATDANSTKHVRPKKEAKAAEMKAETKNTKDQKTGQPEEVKVQAKTVTDEAK